MFGVARRIPAPLAAILLAAVVEALVWICMLPPIQGPDEDSHIAYVQRIADAHTLGWQKVSPPPAGLPPYSTELAYALTLGEVTQTWAHPGARPARTAADARLWEAQQAKFKRGDRANGGWTPALQNPPLYYLYETLPYLATSASSLFGRIFAMRLANIPAFLAAIAFTWLIAGELFGGRQWLQALASAAVALQPLLLDMTAVVNPDVFLAAIWSAALYAMIRAVRYGLSRGNVGAIVGLTAASCLTQPRGLALVIPAGVALALSFWRHHRPWRRRTRRLLVGAAAFVSLCALVVLVNYATLGDPSASRVRQFGSYLWQFYLPRLSFMSPSISPAYGVRQAFVDRFFSGFADLEVVFSPPIAETLRVGLGALGVLGLVGLAVRRRWALRNADVLAVCVMAVVGCLLVLHVVAFRNLLQAPDPVLTGRYLLPLVSLYGVGIAGAVSWLPRRAGPPLGAGLLSGLVLLQLGAIGILFLRFYA